jgi:hypothetical protein
VNPIVVHVVRPYASEQEYLAAEAWSIDARGMLLVDVEALAADTPVLFDIALADGSKPIRAEGRAAGVIAPSGGHPGGLRVRFKRFGAATKAFIERAVRSKSEGEHPSQPDAERPSLAEARQSMTELEAVRPAPSAPDAALPPPLESGVRARRPVPAPANRDELLARLRHRRKAG